MTRQRQQRSCRTAASTTTATMRSPDLIKNSTTTTPVPATWCAPEARPRTAYGHRQPALLGGADACRRFVLTWASTRERRRRLLPTTGARTTTGKNGARNMQQHQYLKAQYVCFNVDCQRPGAAALRHAYHRRATVDRRLPFWRSPQRPTATALMAIIMRATKLAAPRSTPRTRRVLHGTSGLTCSKSVSAGAS